MPKFKDTGLNTTHKQQPISVKFPPEIDRTLRDKKIIANRSDYIRMAVIEAMRRDGLINPFPPPQ